MAAEVVVHLDQNEKRFYNLLSKKGEFIVRLVQHTYQESELKQALSLPFSIQIFENRELVFWNNQQVNMPESVLGMLPNGVSFLFLQNGYYQVIKTTTRDEGGKNLREIIGFFLLQHKYNIDNKYLHSDTNKDLGLPRGYTFSFSTETYSRRIENKAHTSSIYLLYDKTLNDSGGRNLFFWIGLLGLVLLLIWLYKTASFLCLRLNTEVAIGFLILSLFMLRTGIHYLGIPISFSQLSLFQSNSEFLFISGSLGDLLINILIVSIIIIFITDHIKISIREDAIMIYQILWEGFIISFLIISIYGVLNITRYLLLNTSFSLTILDIIDFKSVTILGSLGLILLFYTLFKLTLFLSEGMRQVRLSRIERLIVFLVIWSLFTILLYKKNLDIRYFITFIWCIIFIILSYDEAKRKFTESPFRFIFAAAIYIAFFFSAFLFSTQSERDHNLREALAKKVSLEIDQITEYRFVDISVSIMEDRIVKKYFTNPSLPKSELENRIRKKYFDDYFAKYDIKIFTYLEDGTSLDNKMKQSLAEFEQKIVKAHHTESKYLFLISNPDGNYSYVAKLPIFIEGNLYGFAVIELELNRSGQANVYPELVIADKYKTPHYYDDISYAIYNKGNLRNYYGDYLYPLNIDTMALSGKGDFVKVKLKGNSHLAFLADEDRVVLVTEAERSLKDWFSLFCYVLLIFFIVIVFSSLFYSYVYAKSQKGLFSDIFLSSLKKRINFAILSLVLISLIIMGVVTISYFSHRSIAEQQEQLVYKLAGMISSLEIEMKDKEPLKKSSVLVNNELSLRLKSLADIFGIDVNIYNNDGTLILSSQPNIFEKGLISSNMNPEAYFLLTRKGERQTILNESIGKLRFLSGYGQIKNKIGETIGFLQVPYFAREKDVKTQISNFLITLINVYNLIFLISAIIGFLVSNSITQSLSMIGSKIKNIKLGQSNEKLEWPHEDEIGALVRQYNAVIDELDKSARLLMMSERQIAWESMAKQIAHEIKNPLTPMKLSIQHLLRAQKENRANVGELTERVCKTLIEQIDDLSDIATEFGLYAKMPPTQMEMLVLQDIMRSVLELYPETENINLIPMISKEPIYVYADQAQITRVLHNIMKNAFQAIPENQKGMIIATLSIKDKNAIMSFSDTGVGIPEEQRDKIFTPNFTTKSSGMGLGLAISKNIIANLGGEIWFESKMGKGTTFFVSLPLSPVQ